MRAVTEVFNLVKYFFSILVLGLLIEIEQYFCKPRANDVEHCDRDDYFEHLANHSWHHNFKHWQVKNHLQAPDHFHHVEQASTQELVHEPSHDQNVVQVLRSLLCCRLEKSCSRCVLLLSLQLSFESPIGRMQIVYEFR